MSKKYIAICLNVPLLWDNLLLDKKICKNIIGASWMPILADISKKNGYEVISGDVALREEINPKDIFIVQELNAKHGGYLLKKGSIASILTACESPVISFYFYDKIQKISTSFFYKKLFNGSFDYMDNKNNNVDMFFPSYSIKDKLVNESWEDRKFFVMVAGNKGAHFNIHFIPKGIKQKALWLLVEIYKLISPSFKDGKKNELHSKRIEIIKYFGGKSKLDLFGLFWLDFNRLRKKDIKDLKPILLKLNPTFCDNKINTIKNYKYVFCLENIKYKGYVTEKIIDCLVAGAIPVYLGATNIEEFVPKNCFIDLREFNNMEKLELKLDSISKNEAMDIINNGKSFLKSDKGKKFSYEYYAQDILNMVKSTDDNN